MIIAPARLATIRRDLTNPPGVPDATELRRWRIGYLAGLMLDEVATEPEVYRIIRELPDLAGLVRDAKAMIGDGQERAA